MTIEPRQVCQGIMPISRIVLLKPFPVGIGVMPPHSPSTGWKLEPHPLEMLSDGGLGGDIISFFLQDLLDGP